MIYCQSHLKVGSILVTNLIGVYMQSGNKIKDVYSCEIQKSLDSFIEMEAFFDLMLVKKEFRVSSVEVMKTKATEGIITLQEIQSNLK